MKIELLKINHLQSLGLWNLPKKLKVTSIIDQLGYIQIDAIFTISRSQDTVAHTRSSTYKELEVWKAVERGELFESYAHDLNNLIFSVIRIITRSLHPNQISPLF